ncbi:MAG: PASTA domain-containing protein [Clostridia bacterium]|nr:PASTA domain-containing protein [Clostridia bacterium]
MQNRANRHIPGRTLTIILVFMALWSVLIIRLFSLQIIQHEKYEAKVIDNIERETNVAANRGIIYDCNMVQLATNETTWRVFISPRDIEDQTQAALIATQLSTILDVEYDSIMAKIAKTNRADETIKRDITDEEYNSVITLINEYDLDKQIHYEAYTKRWYPYGSLASSVVGCVGTDGGQMGLELQYNKELTGVAGKYITARDAVGNRMPYKYDSYIEAEHGSNLVTTIDTRVQSVLEAQLKQTYEDNDPEHRVCGIVMDVNSGAILAMGQYPAFDLNDPYTLDADSKALLDESEYVKDSEEYNNYYWELVYGMWRNKAVTETYEPGSTFKVITTAMALEEGVTTFADPYYCEGKMDIEGYDQPIHCHKTTGHGAVSYAEGLQQSCNPTLMQVAAKIGRQDFYDYFNSFGYTRKTGIDLPGEADSIFAEYSAFNNVSLAVYSFGQTFRVTPIQQIRGIATVANGGKLVKPHLVSKIIDDEGNVIKAFDDSAVRQVVSEDVCAEISRVLEEGVSGDGGAKNAYVAGYKIAAKTGTSEKRDTKITTDVVGSTVAYVPSDDPQYAVLIVVDDPQTSSHFGSVVAAPYVANTLSEILPTLGIERQYSEDDSGMITTAVSNYTTWAVDEAKAAIEGKGLKCEVVGDGDVVTAQIPSSGSIIQQESGKIVLYTGDNTPENNLITVPDLKGYGAETANNVLVSYGFNLKIDGTINRAGASVVSQSPAAGEKVPYGSVVTVTVRYFDGTE